MSNYKEQLQQNNNELNTILETVNNLPEAGGSGGGSMETCTVTIENLDACDMHVIATIVENGVETIYTTDGDDFYMSGGIYQPITLHNVKCGSAIVYEMFRDCVLPSEHFYNINGGAEIIKQYRSSDVYMSRWTNTILFKAPSTANEDCHIFIE